jgi:hypothetical protein
MQGEQIFATTDAIAERVRKIGGTTLRSIGQIGRMQRVLDNDADFVSRGAPRRQQAADSEFARDARPLRRARRRGQCESDRKLDRRSRETHMVPVRGESRPMTCDNFFAQALLCCGMSNVIGRSV